MGGFHVRSLWHENCGSMPLQHASVCMFVCCVCVLMCLQVSVRKEVGTRKMVGERVRVGHGDGAEE